MNITMTKKKNPQTPQCMIKKHTTKERIVDLEDRTEEITWIASWRHKEWKNMEKKLKDMENRMKRSSNQSL